MPMCAMIGCSARSKSAAQKTNMEPGIGLYCLPKVITRQCGRTKALSEERRRLWLARINRKDMKNLDYVRVCGRHFISGKPASLMDDTNPDWVPSQHLGYTNGAGPGMKTTGRYERAKDRRANKAVAQQCVGTQPAEDDPPSPEMSEVNENAEQEMCAEGSSETDLVKEAAVQTVVTMEYISTLEEDRTRLASELREAEEAKKKLEVTADSLRDDPAKVAFYTGLSSFARLFAVFQMVECVVKHTQQNGLGKFQEFVVFLMKLRCNFPLQDLGYRFGVSDSTVSRIFEKWLNAAFWRLKPLISWPSRNAIQKTMPQAFLDSFGSKVAVIIDCFEVKIERPSSMEPRSETWSQYESSNTAKYLIGISPQGHNLNSQGVGWNRP